MRAKARMWRLLTLAYSWLVASAPPPRTSSFERQEPNLGGRAAPFLAPRAEEDFDDEDDDEEIPATRAPRRKAAARAPGRRESEKLELPPITVLSAPKASDGQQ